MASTIGACYFQVVSFNMIATPKVSSTALTKERVDTGHYADKE